MKKVFAILTIGFAIAATACADNDVISRNTNDLPAPARATLKQHFPHAKVSYIKIEKEWPWSTTYEVQLVHGAEISFNSKGEWIEVDCKQEAVPVAFIPAQIRSQVKEMFPDEQVTKIERDSRDYEVELYNDVDLKFNKKFKIVKVD